MLVSIWFSSSSPDTGKHFKDKIIDLRKECESNYNGNFQKYSKKKKSIIKAVNASAASTSKYQQVTVLFHLYSQLCHS